MHVQVFRQQRLINGIKFCCIQILQSHWLRQNAQCDLPRSCFSIRPAWVTTITRFLFFKCTAIKHFPFNPNDSKNFRWTLSNHLKQKTRLTMFLFIISCGLHLLFLYLIERYRWRSVFPWLLFVDQALFSHSISLASSAHASQEGLWWTEDSCSGVSIISRVTN